MNWNQVFTPIARSSQDEPPELLLSYLPSFGAIEVSGEDKKSYLQGQLTCDLNSLTPNSVTMGAHCDAKGKMWSIFHLFQDKDQYVLIQRQSGIAQALAQLKKYAVFSNIEISLSNKLCFGLIGTDAQSFINQHSEEKEGSIRHLLGAIAVQITPSRWFISVSQENAPFLISHFEDGHKVDESIWDCYDILDAIPSLEAQEQEKYIPQNMNLQALDAISFKKGCYTGQETIARAKYRGTNKRALHQLISAQIPHQTMMALKTNQAFDIEQKIGENWRSCNHLLRQYCFDDGFLIGLIVLANDLPQDSLFRLTLFPEIELRLAPLPYSVTK